MWYVPCVYAYESAIQRAQKDAYLADRCQTGLVVVVVLLEVVRLSVKHVDQYLYINGEKVNRRVSKPIRKKKRHAKVE